MRGIQLYHVQGNGWNDIGYNFLVDRFGTVYEGRYGGIERNVVGAHAQGFNTGSVGVAVSAPSSRERPRACGREALERLLAWRLDVAHADPHDAERPSRAATPLPAGESPSSCARLRSS